jgi:hypothetical protein
MLAAGAAGAAAGRSQTLLQRLLSLVLMFAGLARDASDAAWCCLGAADVFNVGSTLVPSYGLL